MKLSCYILTLSWLIHYTSALGQPPLTKEGRRLLPTERYELVNPPIGSKTLFYIQRSPNTAVVMYEVQTDKTGKINQEEPVDMYWISYNGNGLRNDLNFFQRRLAYGVDATSRDGGKNIDFQVVSYRKRTLHIVENSDGSFQANMLINGQMAKLKNVFIEVAQNLFIPEISFAEIFGENLETGEDVYEKIFP